MVVWRPVDGRIRLASPTVVQLLGLSPDDLVGRSIFDLAPLEVHACGVAHAIAAGSIDICRLECAGGHSRTRLGFVTRALQLDAKREAVTILIPETSVGSPSSTVGLGAEDMLFVLGHTDRSARIRAVTSNVEELTGRTYSQCIGLRLDELPPFGAGTGSEFDDEPYLRTVTGLLAPSVEPDNHGGQTFMLAADPLAGRLFDQEEGVEVTWAGARAGGPAQWLLPGRGRPVGDPRLAELTSRQVYILECLVGGERVPGIARTLFVSQSTVRNHLAVLFRKFGVHSQPELIEVLRMGIGGRVRESAYHRFGTMRMTTASPSASELSETRT